MVPLGDRLIQVETKFPLGFHWALSLSGQSSESPVSTPGFVRYFNLPDLRPPCRFWSLLTGDSHGRIFTPASRHSSEQSLVFHVLDTFQHDESCSTRWWWWSFSNDWPTYRMHVCPSSLKHPNFNSYARLPKKKLFHGMTCISTYCIRQIAQHILSSHSHNV